MFWKNKNTRDKTPPGKPGESLATTGNRKYFNPPRQKAYLQALEQRIDEKIALLEALEKKAGERIKELDRLICMHAQPESSRDVARRPRVEEMLALKAKGLQAEEIAGILSVPAGEVELILDLHKK